MKRRSTSFLIKPDFVLQLVALGVFGNGILLLASTLRTQIIGRLAHTSTLVISLPLLIGITLVYLATLLRRRKRAAWFVVLPVYGALLGLNLAETAEQIIAGRVEPLQFIRSLLLPAVVVAGLIAYRREFMVKSDIRSFTLSLRAIALVLGVVLLYGTLGFHYLDKRDFHESLGWGSAIHHTVDQFDFTTDRQLMPHTRRGNLFIGSLNIMSAGAVLYALISLFQPLRARFADQAHNRQHARELLEKYPATSEDYFKLWPEDKSYFFSDTGQAALAFKVERGVALVGGDPFGNPKDYNPLLISFFELCYTNDWLPAFIHIESKHSDLYKSYDLSIQKIGEEAIMELDSLDILEQNKYFRNIRSKFEKQGYNSELLLPPHNPAVLARLREVSNDWLKRPGRTERSFMMGYFSDAYLQQCPIMVLRDAASTIQAFMNQLPVINPQEINYDLLRHAQSSLGNSNDYLLLEFARYAHSQGFKRLNLGLCPLAGLDSGGEEDGVINNTLRFVYANTDRLYSFSGLQRFKAKYEPEWENRYIVYKGGIRGFTRTLNALNRAMKAPTHHGPF